MDPEKEQAIKANLFHAAHPAVEDWNKFPWHSGVTQPHSSQALAIDVFGTLKVAAQEMRDLVCGNIAAKIGLPQEGPWQVKLEWVDPQNVLKEAGNPTQIDAIASSPRSLIYLECKFTETDGGCCSQPNPLSSGPNKGKIQCNGNYSWQINPVTGHEGKCALTSKGSRYWEVAPNVLKVDPSSEYSPCPFSGPVYQWMRNLSLCWLQGKASNRRPGFLVVYVDAPHLPMAQKTRTKDWQDFQGLIRQEQIGFGTFSYQQVIQKTLLSMGLGDQNRWTWIQLQNWVERKIDLTKKL